jgi:hypothetical protein
MICNYINEHCTHIFIGLWSEEKVKGIVAGDATCDRSFGEPSA